MAFTKHVRKLFSVHFHLILTCLLALNGTYGAEPGPLQSSLTSTPESLSTETYRLWQTPAPGATGDSEADIPTITVYRPRPERTNGTAVVIAPGGAYIGLASSLEGTEPAMWFTARGITAFVLTYRVGEAARLPEVLQDGARAMRFVRFHANAFSIDPDRVGMMGFSAGAHLAASTALGMANAPENSADPVNQADSQPDFLILGYPWLEGTRVRDDGGSSYCDFAAFLNIDCTPADYGGFLPVNYVTEATPPTFIFHTSNDELVPIGGSVRFYSALREHGVDAEFHAFRNGPHGVGLGGTDPALTLWTELLDQWLLSFSYIGSRTPAN